MVRGVRNIHVSEHDLCTNVREADVKVHDSGPITLRVTAASGKRIGAYALTVDLKTNDLTFIQGRPQQ